MTVKMVRDTGRGRDCKVVAAGQARLQAEGEDEKQSATGRRKLESKGSSKHQNRVRARSGSVGRWE